MNIGRFLTPETIRLAIVGVAAGSLAGLVWWLAGRTRWGAAPFLLAVLAAARYSDRSDWPRWDVMAAVGGLVTLAAAVGAARLLADPSTDWRWVAAGGLFSAAGVWAAVPETGPAVLAGGSLTGLFVTGWLSRCGWRPTAGLGMAAVVGWAALSGAAGRPWAALGGAMCTGMAPFFAVRPRVTLTSRSRNLGPWLLGAHVLLVMLAARWIGVTPHAGWLRVGALAAVGLAVALITRGRA